MRRSHDKTIKLLVGIKMGIGNVVELVKIFVEFYHRCMKILTQIKLTYERDFRCYGAMLLAFILEYRN